MTRKFFERVMKERVVDTKDYRYLIDERGSNRKAEN